MTTYVRDLPKRKWHTARPFHGRAVLPGEYTPTLCNRTVKARAFTTNRHETNRAGLCYQCGRKEGLQNG